MEPAQGRECHVLGQCAGLQLTPVLGRAGEPGQAALGLCGARSLDFQRRDLGGLKMSQVTGRGMRRKPGHLKSLQMIGRTDSF